jgi:hypothetical protein
VESGEKTVKACPGAIGVADAADVIGAVGVVGAVSAVRLVWLKLCGTGDALNVNTGFAHHASLF